MSQHLLSWQWLLLRTVFHIIMPWHLSLDNISLSEVAPEFRVLGEMIILKARTTRNIRKIFGTYNGYRKPNLVFCRDIEAMTLISVSWQRDCWVFIVTSWNSVSWLYVTWKGDFNVVHDVQFEILHIWYISLAMWAPLFMFKLNKIKTFYSKWKSHLCNLYGNGETKNIYIYIYQT